VISAADGVLLAARNSSRALRKLSEIYDQIAFAAVGKWSEFEALRVAGIRYADLRGYSYDRADVTARGLAGAYAQTISAAFTTDAKPLEVELAVAQVGAEQQDDAVFHVTYDGTVSDESPWAVLGGAPSGAIKTLAAGWHPGLKLNQVASLARAVLDPKGELDGAGSAAAGSGGADFEVAWLDRAVPGRAFQRWERLP
jgi:proteasome alpha subunit